MATIAVRPLSPDVIDAPAAAAYATKTTSDPSREFVMAPYEVPVSGSVTPGTTKDCLRAFVESNSRMYTGAIFPFPMAVTPSPTCRTTRLFCAMAFHAVDVPVPVAVDVGVTLREADTVTVGDRDCEAVTVFEFTGDFETDDVVDVDTLPLNDAVAAPVITGVNERIAVFVGGAVLDADAVDNAENVGLMVRDWVAEMNAEFERRPVPEEVCENMTDLEGG